MKYRKINAIISVGSLKAVEQALQHEKVIGVAITHIKGYGDYKNFYDPEWISTSARVEVFVRAEHAEQVARDIMRTAYSGHDTDGLIAVLPVEDIYHIKDYLPQSGL